MRDFRYIFADPADAYAGTKASLWVLVGATVLATVRSLIHMFYSDGGANSIAGLPIAEGEAWENLVAIFAQWGYEQLIIAAISWVIIVRYRFLTPFALLVHLVDWVGRGALEQLKPIITQGHSAPGEIGNIIFPPLLAIALWFALPRKAPRTQ